MDEEGNLHISVENKMGYELPNTGSNVDLLLKFAGMCAMAVVYIREKRRII